MEKFRQLGRETFSSLSVKNYRLYYIGQAISTCGTWMQIVAQAFLVLQLGGSGTALGLLMGMQFLPILLFGAYAGVIVDRFSKRRILVITQTCSSILALILGLLVWFNQIELWGVYALAFCLGIINAFDMPSRQTFIFEMVGKNKLRNAVSLNSMLGNGSRIIGPAIAGILISTLGLALCFILNAVSYIAVIIMLFLMDKRGLYPAKRTKQLKGKLQEGLVYVKNNGLLLYVLIMAVIIGMISFEFNVTLPLMAAFSFNDKTAFSYAVLTSSMGVGAVLGALYSASRKNSTMTMLTVSSFLFGISMLIMSVMPSLPLGILAMIFVGFFSINVLNLFNTLLQLTSAPEMRGRVMSLYTIAIFGTTPIGAPLIGWIGDVIGPRASMATGGIAALCAACVGLFFLRKFTTPQEQDILQTTESLVVSPKKN